MSNKPLAISVYADGAELEPMLKSQRECAVDGFTTNPTLMRKAGISDYEAFAKKVLQHITDLPISFEVFSDDINEMESQARTIASWGKNVNVKIPITNTKGETTLPMCARLLSSNIKLNITAIMTLDQVSEIEKIANIHDDIIVSIFAGRIADTGIDPLPVMTEAVSLFQNYKSIKVLWASPREVLNAYQADQCGCDIITMTPSLIAKLKLYNKNLENYSLDTVKMFRDDAVAAGYDIDSTVPPLNKLNRTSAEV